MTITPTFTETHKKPIRMLGLGLAYTPTAGGKLADSAVPIWETGEGVPTHDRVDGSLYVNVSAGTIYVRRASAWVGDVVNSTIADSAGITGGDDEDWSIAHDGSTGLLITLADGDADAMEIVDASANSYLTIDTNAVGVTLGQNTTVSGTVDIAKTVTAADQTVNIDGTINHATGALVALDVTAVQSTTGRTAGTVDGVKSKLTSLAGDANSVVYADFRAAAPTDGGGTVVHAGFVAEAHDYGFWALDAVGGLALGTGLDDVIGHGGTATLWTHTTGNLTIDNQAGTGATILLLGTDDTNTKLAVQNNSAADIFSVTPASATAGTTLVAGVLDVNGTLDLDAALTGAGDGADVAATIDHATASAQGLAATITQGATVRTGGIAAAGKFTAVSTADENGGDFACVQLAATDGGGTTTHSGLYCASALDALLKVDASGSGGVAVSADGMTANPETDTEAGYITILVGATAYQIPIYAA